MLRLGFLKIGFLFLLFFVALESCTTTDKVSYFQNLPISDTKTKVEGDIRTRIKTDDQLYIFVSSNNIELAANYNLPNFSVASANMQQGSTQSNPVLGYVVEGDSTVTLPKIGKVKIVGLTFEQAETLIAQKLEDKLKDPIVHIRVINFKVSVLGDVRSPGTFNVPYNKINILQALGLAGDLNITGVRETISIIRNENGVLKTKRIDLREKDYLNSSDFWLQNGDIIYVQPNQQKINTSKVAYQSWPLIISTATLLLLVVNNLSKL